MIIGIVAGILIAVVLVILAFMWYTSNDDRNYKADPDKRTSYQGANAALLGHSSCTNGSRPLNGASNVPLNGSMRLNGSDKGQVPGLVPQKPKKRDSKDIKEWYV